jgi:hypothetical protein
MLLLGTQPQERKGAGNMLAVTTMALDHHQWLRGALVTVISSVFVSFVIFLYCGNLLL